MSPAAVRSEPDLLRRRTETWLDHNHAVLSRRLRRLKDQLTSGSPGADAGGGSDDLSGDALEALQQTFALSEFERETLLLAAALELDGAFADALTALQGPGGALVTFSLALAILPGAHWSALLPDAPLRRFRLLELGGESPAFSPLRVPERILHCLRGLQCSEPALTGVWKKTGAAAPLPPSLESLAQRLRALAQRGVAAFQLKGSPASDRESLASRTADLCGLELKSIDARSIPEAPHERENLARLLEREAALGGWALYVEAPDDAGEEALRRTLSLFAALPTLRFLATRETTACADLLPVEVSFPDASEQRELWLLHLGERAGVLQEDLERVLNAYSLSAARIAALARLINAAPDEAPLDLQILCRDQAGMSLNELATRIRPAARWEDLVVSAENRAILEEIVRHLRQRMRVYEDWGFAGGGRRGLGITALFSGPSGAGKTLAAEVIAGELELDLYRVDLSALVSKYIGETEKNLRRVFDEAESGGCVLLFDEADALFGKRSEVNDSHDRYANLEVSYLLQRMEQYRGLAILTTNLKSAIDAAFMRRLRFVAHFALPDATQRAEIWRRAFPARTPTLDLDPERLARLTVSGGSIRNIALGAAFLAADGGRPVQMEHIYQAARNEYAKLEKSVSAAEFGRL